MSPWRSRQNLFGSGAWRQLGATHRLELRLQPIRLGDREFNKLKTIETQRIFKQHGGLLQDSPTYHRGNMVSNETL